jgi:hypothetical protein
MCSLGIFQMMLTIFSAQGRVNRAFFDQRAEKYTPGTLADESPGTLFLGVPGRRKPKIARGSSDVFSARRPNYAADR